MTNYSQSMRDALELVYTRNQEKIAELNEKMSSAQIAKLKKAYEPMRNKRISTSNAGYTLAHSYDWHQWFHVNSGGSFVAAPAGSILADMDANDEAYIYFGIYGGTKVVSIDNGYLTAILVA